MRQRLCVYVVTHDTGFAPNPFGGYCTLAACTPNRQGVRLARGDWLVGHSGVRRGRRLVYAMEVTEVLGFDAYYRDARFAAKHPRFDRTWKEACGDNIYHRESGRWTMDANPFHPPSEYLDKDTRHPSVFVAERFFYFGENAPPIPEEFEWVRRTGRGCRCNDAPEVVKSFIRWIEAEFTPGVHGDPTDRRPLPPRRTLVPLKPGPGLRQAKASRKPAAGEGP